MEEEYKLEIISYDIPMPHYDYDVNNFDEINKLYENHHKFRIEQIRNEVRWQREAIKKCKHEFKKIRSVEGNVINICKKCGINQWDVVEENIWRHSFKDIE